MTIRWAKPGDEDSIIGLIQELATFENEPDAVINTAEQLAIDLFDKNVCEAFVLELDSTIIGFALFYTSYSTWNGACVYLEDLYIQEAHRRSGLGEQLFNRVVEEAKKRKVRRMDWQVLDWNEPAIKFYKKLGATIDEDWYNGRLFFN